MWAEYYYPIWARYYNPGFRLSGDTPARVITDNLQNISISIFINTFITNSVLFTLQMRS